MTAGKMRLGNLLVLRERYRRSLIVLHDRIAAAESTGSKLDPAIKTLLNDKTSGEWEPIYEAEERLVPFMSDSMIIASAASRLVEAERLDIPTASNLKARFESATTEEARREVFAVLLDDIHFRYAKRQLDMQKLREITLKVNYFGAGLLSIIILGALTLTFVVSVETANHLQLGAVILFGAAGALFSRLIALQSGGAALDYDALLSAFRTVFIILRLIVGVFGSIVLYYCFVGQLLGGDLFPNYTESATLEVGAGGTSAFFPSVTMAKLIFWSFLAGFSERLVPDTLANFEKADTKSKTKEG